MGAKACAIGAGVADVLVTLVMHRKFRRPQAFAQALLDGAGRHGLGVCSGRGAHDEEPVSLPAVSAGLMWRLMSSICSTTNTTMMTGPPKVLKFTQLASLTL